MTNEDDSSSLSPLPDVLSKGLVAVSTFGLLSFFCSISLFLYLSYRLITWHHYSTIKTPTNQFLFLIYNLLLADIQQACAFLLNISALRNNAILVDTPVCFAQGWFISTGDLASSVFICAIAIHTFLGVVKGYRLPTRAFYYCVASCWIFVYAMAAIGPIIHGKNFYGRAAAWCWINSAYSRERLWLHYFWIFVAMFSTILIYAVIYFCLRCKPPSAAHKDNHGATPLMILYPLIYTVCTAPLACLRIFALAGNEVDLSYFCMAGTMIACNGWLDVLLYASTRADIVFAELPPSEETGLDTFAFMGKVHKKNASMGGESAVRRSDESESVAHIYSIQNIGVKNTVAQSIQSTDVGEALGNESAVSAHTSGSWDRRSFNTVRST